jgi:hypothetical protein
MANDRTETMTKPTQTILGSGASEVVQTISPCAPTPAYAYDLSNEQDAAGAGFLNLIRAHHALGRRNVEKLTVSMQALAAVKTPKEFVALQQKFLTESLAAAVSDGAAIGKLTTAAFTAAFDPMRRKIGDLRAGTKRQE